CRSRSSSTAAIRPTAVHDAPHRRRCRTRPHATNGSGSMTTRLTLTILASLAIGGTAMIAPSSRSASPERRLPHAAGASVTMLSNGNDLVVGGEGGSAEPRGRDRDSGIETIVPARLAVPRAWHSATVLPDGRVLAWGGIDEHDEFVSTAEIFDPDVRTWATLGTIGAPRA